MRRFKLWMFAAIILCGTVTMITSCLRLMDTESVDNPIAENMIKQGVWTEHDTALSASGKYTEEELE